MQMLVKRDNPFFLEETVRTLVETGEDVVQRRLTHLQAAEFLYEALLRQALQALGEHQRVVNYLHEAKTLAVTLDDLRRLGWWSQTRRLDLVQHPRAPRQTGPTWWGAPLPASS
jgi:hypothetical protein